MLIERHRSKGMSIAFYFDLNLISAKQPSRSVYSCSESSHEHSDPRRFVASTSTTVASIFTKRLAACISNLFERYSYSVPWIIDNIASAPAPYRPPALPLNRVEVLLFCELVPHKRIVTHNKTTVISPVAMCTVQARYEGAREHSKERNPISSTPGCMNVYEMQQARRCTSRRAALTCLMEHNQQVQMNKHTGLLDHFRLYAVREHTLVPSNVLAWVPDISFP